MLTTTQIQTIIITDRQSDDEIGRIHIHLTPDMNTLDAYRAVHIAITKWGEENGRIFNELDWRWQPIEVSQ